MSQADLAKKLGVAQKTVSRIETGESEPSDEVEKSLRKLGYKGPLVAQGLLQTLDLIESAAQQLAARGFKPPTEQAAHEMRRLIGQILENSRGDSESLADRVERVIRMAEAIRK